MPQCWKRLSCWWPPSRMGLGSEKSSPILDNLSPFLLGKEIGQSVPRMAASCLTMTKLSGHYEPSKDACFWGHSYATIFWWKELEKNPIFYSLLLLGSSNLKSQDSIKWKLIRTLKAHRGFLPLSGREDSKPGTQCFVLVVVLFWLLFCFLLNLQCSCLSLPSTRIIGVHHNAQLVPRFSD
jgi:hypothetical protein